MSMQIGAPIRIVGLLGLVAALALGAWMFVLSGKSSSGKTGSSAQHSIAAAQSAAAKLNAHNKATALGAPGVVQTAKTPNAAAAHAAKVRPVRAKGAAPTTIASVLRHHRVAVVLLYDPDAKVDFFSLGEAQRGADRAGAGFLRVNILRQRQVELVANTYGVMRVPTVLFFARPGKLVQKIVGFADQDTVAQAARNAARGLVATQR
jgi:thiol:disulfide interchange protein